jgi:hypothetical protein
MCLISCFRSQTWQIRFVVRLGLAQRTWRELSMWKTLLNSELFMYDKLGTWLVTWKWNWFFYRKCGHLTYHIQIKPSVDILQLIDPTEEDYWVTQDTKLKVEQQKGLQLEENNKIIFPRTIVLWHCTSGIHVGCYLFYFIRSWFPVRLNHPLREIYKSFQPTRH